MLLNVAAFATTLSTAYYSCWHYNYGRPLASYLHSAPRHHLMGQHGQVPACQSPHNKHTYTDRAHRFPPRLLPRWLRWLCGHGGGVPSHALCQDYRVAIGIDTYFALSCGPGPSNACTHSALYDGLRAIGGGTLDWPGAIGAYNKARITREPCVALFLRTLYRQLWALPLMSPSDDCVAAKRGQCQVRQQCSGHHSI